MIALISDSGATSESAKDAISLRAQSAKSEMRATGEVGISVSAINVAPLDFAYFIASTVRAL